MKRRSRKPAPDAAAKAPGSSWPSRLLTFGLALIVIALFLGAEARKLEKINATFLDARATLLSTSVEEWIPGLGDWNPFGTFDVVVGDRKVQAKGSLKSHAYAREQRRKHGRKYRTPKPEAESLLASWTVGATYDAVWDPEHPDHVFFQRADASGTMKVALGMLAVGIALFAAAILTARAQSRGRRS